MPPRWVRRTVLAPAVVVLPLLLITSLPLTVLVAAIASRWMPGRWRPLRLLWVLLTFLVVESLTILATFGLWVASGFGRHVARSRWQHAHYGLMKWYLDVVLGAAERRLHLRFDLRVDHDQARSGASSEGLATSNRPEVAAGVATGAASRSRPLIVLSRHAGPGDSFLLVHGLLRAGYRPRIVLRAALRWLPSLDIVLHRVPSHFVHRGAPPGTGTAAVAALASDLGPGDALVLFPEGRNFTPARRTRSIAKLEEDGAHDDAEEARELRHVLMPRTGGALAALDAAPGSDVLFVAHWGLEDLSGVVDLWRGLPMDRAIEVEAWLVEADQIPGPREARAAWLAWWWRRVDAWLVDRHGVDAVPDTVVDAVAELRDELEEVPLEAGHVEVPWAGMGDDASPNPTTPASETPDGGGDAGGGRA
jgi:1-acyl-sn-glycerol-3-phosphate acyltransferase